MTQQPIPLLDGRRAVPGDIVECVNDTRPWKRDNTTATSFGPKIGERLKVVEVAHDLYGKMLCFKEYFIDLFGDEAAFEAECFVIIPPDTKAETRIAIETVKERTI